MKLFNYVNSLRSLGLLGGGVAAHHYGSPVLLYKGLMNGYLKAQGFPDQKGLSQYTPKQMNRHLKDRRKQIVLFNCMFIPLVVGITYWRASLLREINVQINPPEWVNIESNLQPNDKTSISSLNFFSLGFLNKNIIYILPIFLLSSKYLLFPYLKKYYPFAYDKIIEIIDFTTPYVGITIIYWYFIITFFILLDLVFFLIICSYNENIILHQYWPSFIKNYLNNLFEYSQEFSTPLLRKQVIKLKIRTFLIHSFISIVALLLYNIFM